MNMGSAASYFVPPPEWLQTPLSEYEPPNSVSRNGNEMFVDILDREYPTESPKRFK